MSLPEAVLSASRRTDIPAFYLDWFMEGIVQEVFNVTHPYTRKPRQIKVEPEKFHSIVFWSKNYGPFLQAKAGDRLIKKGYHLYFNFTINSESPDLEPGLPPLHQRLDQLRQLSQTFGPQTISWRFDPICFYTSPETGREKNNLTDFLKIADHAARAKIPKCVTSFFDPYKKIERRLSRLKKQGKISLEFTRLSRKQETRVLARMAAVLKQRQIRLHLCCEKETAACLEPGLDIRENACIDGNHLKSVYGGNPETKKDTGQRSTQGCRCTKSIDIGSYDLHPCFHNCLFCYANPEMDTRIYKA